jgi:hypothetical protein
LIHVGAAAEAARQTLHFDLEVRVVRISIPSSVGFSALNPGLRKNSVGRVTSPARLK